MNNTDKLCDLLENDVEETKSIVSVIVGCDILISLYNSDRFVYEHFDDGKYDDKIKYVGKISGIKVFYDECASRNRITLMKTN